MKVLDLCCAHQHSFEGWFASEDDFQTQLKQSLISCPLCDNTDVRRLPSAPRLNIMKQREPDSGDTLPAQPSETGAWLKAVYEFIDQTEDVGERFAEEARRIHYGETQQRGIRGQASVRQAQELREEGIDVLAVPLPQLLKGPLQ